VAARHGGRGEPCYGEACRVAYEVRAVEAGSVLAKRRRKRHGGVTSYAGRGGALADNGEDSRIWPFTMTAELPAGTQGGAGCGGDGGRWNQSEALW
jgi:hypothetical protein